jgi:mono/diheme cytochrome c family protein
MRSSKSSSEHHSETRGAGRLFRRRFFFALGLIATLAACEKRPATPEDPLVARGRSVYQATCIACHNPDPRVAGSVGPDIAGASKELLEARIKRRAYPEGYQPKRKTRLMPTMPQVAGEIGAIHAFLNSVK